MSKATYSPQIGMLDKYMIANQFGDYNGLFNVNPALQAIFDIEEKGLAFFDSGPGTFTRASQAAVWNSKAILESVAINDPRIEHDPLTAKTKGLLSEELRTNIIPQSNTSTFSLNNSTRGSLFNANGVKGYFYTSAAGLPNAFIGIAESAGTRYYSSQVFVAPGTSTFTRCELIVDNNSNRGGSVQFNFDTETFSGEVTYPAYITNFRYSYEKLNDGYIIYLSGELVVTSIVTMNVFWEEATSLNIANAQIEQGTSSSSFIETTGATATRSADVAVVSGASFTDGYNQDENTVYVRFYKDDTGSIGHIINISDGTTDEQILLYRKADNEICLVINTGGVEQVNISSAVEEGETSIAFGFKENDLIIAINGSQVGTDNTLTMPAVDQMDLGEDLNGVISRVVLLPKILTNQEILKFSAH